ncbi:hypothetical protein scyTo_0005640 [Scyliorhinus torazame]|uniref:Uncharacterized protein n=1 Tax=Scyliorhinus torazame TaxID=75743 RepID=A0A401PAY3_SCYTO|nr:hypothetical protein [Scyliorhinus torazame]
MQLNPIAAPKGAPIQITSQVNSHPLVMELDMGAAVSVIGKQAFEKIQSEVQQLTLRDTEARLGTYTWKPLGIAWDHDDRSNLREQSVRLH